MTNPDMWRVAIDDALVNSGLDCLAPNEQPKDALQRLLDWHETMVLDPRISKQAVALQTSGQEPNMFWNDNDQEVCHMSIHDVLDAEWRDGTLEIGDTRVIQQAVNVPKITVRVIEDENVFGEFDYEIVEQAKPKATLLEPCCPNEKRNMRGGCTSCGDPCL